MKRLFAALTAVMMLCGLAFAETVQTDYGFSIEVPGDKLPYVNEDRTYFATDDRSVIVLIIPTQQEVSSATEMLSSVFGTTVTSDDVETVTGENGMTAIYMDSTVAGYTDRVYAISGGDTLICVTADFPESDTETWNETLNAMIASIVFD